MKTMSYKIIGTDCVTRCPYSENYIGSMACHSCGCHMSDVANRVMCSHDVTEALYKYFADYTLETFEGVPTQEIREWLQEQIPAKREIPQGKFAEMDGIVKDFCNDIDNAIMRISDGNNK